MSLSLKVAILNASSDSREAPWYGPWNIVLQDLFQNFCPKNYCTATYPQFPLVKDIDVVDSEDEDENSDNQMNKFRRSAAPSPDSPAASKGLPHWQSLNPPINSVLQNYWRPAPTPDSHEAFKGYHRSGLHRLPQTPPPKMSGLRSKKKWRSVRIPDFAQLVFRVGLKSGNTIKDYLVGILLLVEIKKTNLSCWIEDFLQVLDQTGQQARHAFASYPQVSILGLVIALGDCWTYREYFRKDMRPSPPLSEYLDPTFVDSDSDSDWDFAANTYADVEAAFGTPGFARLETEESNKALAAVRKRLGVIGSNMFPG